MIQFSRYKGNRKQTTTKNKFITHPEVVPGRYRADEWAAARVIPCPTSEGHRNSWGAAAGGGPAPGPSLSPLAFPRARLQAPRPLTAVSKPDGFSHSFILIPLVLLRHRLLPFPLHQPSPSPSLHPAPSPFFRHHGTPPPLHARRKPLLLPSRPRPLHARNEGGKTPPHLHT